MRYRSHWAWTRCHVQPCLREAGQGRTPKPSRQMPRLHQRVQQVHKYLELVRRGEDQHFLRTADGSCEQLLRRSHHKAAHIDTLKRCCREQIAAAATNKAKNTQILDTASGLLNELSQVHHSGKPYEELSKLMKRAQLDLKQLRPLDKLQSTFYTFTESLNVIDNCKLTLKKSEDDMWVCRFCSLLNPQTSAVCDVCLGRRQRCKLCNCEHDESEPCMTNDFSASSGPAARRYQKQGSKAEIELIEAEDNSANKSI
mmetsp:Transcript_599/g.1003  ORF Transcript_599/g.1003 Transcript_599/m.1003 type:complete len:256 (+) Transcript_599:315-1082(+)